MSSTCRCINDSLSKNPAPIHSLTKNRLDHLPDDLLLEVSHYLTPKDLAKLPEVSQNFCGLFQKKATYAAVQKLLNHMLQKNYMEVEAMLQKNPKFLLLKAKITDDSGCVISVTPYQMALYLVEAEIREMIRARLVDIAGEKEAIAQYNEILPIQIRWWK